MNGKRTVAILASVVAWSALVLPTVAGAAGAGPAPALSNPPEQWAYGAQFWDNQSEIGSFGQYNSSTYFAWHVVITLTNTSTTTAEIQGVRTIGLTYYAQFCRPNCTSANLTGTLSARAWQQDTAYVNLTSTATVYVHGAHNSSVATAALGILNASAGGKANLTESYKVVHGSTTLAKGHLDVARSSHLGVVLHPALGLVPWNLSTGERWNSTSDFTASGGWNDSYSYSNSVHGLSTSGSASSSGTVSHSGTVSLWGADRGNLTLKHGRTVIVVVLAVSGPFELRDGLFLAPAGSDLFGGATSDWAIRAYSLPSEATVTSDVAMDAIHHGAVFAAASASVGAGASALGSSALTTSSGSVGAGAPPSSGATIQAQPETVATAQKDSQCLVSGCPGASSGGLTRASMLSIALVGAVVVAAIVGIFVAVRMRSRPRAPPTATTPGGDEPRRS